MGGCRCICHHWTVTAPSPPRQARDRCPGLLRPHAAVDGALVRIRLPGGRVPAASLAELSALVAEFGNGTIGLTSRGNLQLRAVPVDAAGELPVELVDRIVSTGLLPSAEHELVRNIACSPLTGRVGGLADLRPLVTELDRLICGNIRLAALPGRFLFGLDDGRGDIASTTADLGVRAVGADLVRIRAGQFQGDTVPLHRAAEILVRLAEAFLELRGTGQEASWHVRELSDGGRSLLSSSPGQGRGADHPGQGDICGERDTRLGAAAPAPEFGRLTQYDGRMLLSFAVPLGQLDRDQVTALAALAGNGSGELIVTSWRGVLVPDLPSDVRFALPRLSLDPESGWRHVTACTGAPGCAKAAGPTAPVATALARQLAGTASAVHVVGCERRCGSPAADHLEVLLSDLPGAPALSVSRRQPSTVDGEVVATPMARTDSVASLVGALAGARAAS